MNRKLPDITESAPELKDRLRSESVGYKKQRLTAVYLLQSGGANLIGVNRKTVGWLAYQAGGIEQMLDRRYPPGRSPLLSEARPRRCGQNLTSLRALVATDIQQFIASSGRNEL